MRVIDSRKTSYQTPIEIQNLSTSARSTFSSSLAAPNLLLSSLTDTAEPWQLLIPPLRP